MGTIYDFFGKESWIDYDGVTDLQKQNRLLLQSVMKKLVQTFKRGISILPYTMKLFLILILTF